MIDKDCCPVIARTGPVRENMAMSSSKPTQSPTLPDPPRLVKTLNYPLSRNLFFFPLTCPLQLRALPVPPSTTEVTLNTRMRATLAPSAQVASVSLDANQKILNGPNRRNTRRSRLLGASRFAVNRWLLPSAPIESL